jgi:hypothetical protein
VPRKSYVEGERQRSMTFEKNALAGRKVAVKILAPMNESSAL